MARHALLSVADQRRVGPLCWLTLQAPELARSVRPGHYLLVRCADTDSADPLLRRALFIAAAEEQLGQIGLLYTPDERGLAWLARLRAGDTLDVLGPFGQPFEIDRASRTLLLLGEGPGLNALLLLAAQASQRGCAVTLLAGAADTALLPPPFLLPDMVEYQSTVGSATSLLLGPPLPAEPLATSKRQKKQAATATPAPSEPALIPWADQIAAALPVAALPPLADAVRAAKFRWERGFAQVLVASPLVCGVGACGVCATELRGRQRLLCADGPVVDLRDALP